jgi:hypothetical protein
MFRDYFQYQEKREGQIGNCVKHCWFKKEDQIAVYLVRAFPDSISEYVSQVYAGLAELSVAGRVKLRFSSRFSNKARKFYKHAFCTLFLEVTDLISGQGRNIFFDFIDAHDTFSIDDLNRTDIYFKRSYYQPIVDTLDEELRSKILPYGLQYCCRSKHETAVSMMRRFFLFNYMHKRLLTNPMSAFRQTVGRPLRVLLANAMKLHGAPPLLVTDFEEHPDKPGEPRVYFRTRVYDVERTADPSVREVNETRANTIRSLKKNLGDRFVGGLQPSTFAMAHYPDCTCPDHLNTAQHIANTKRYLINVTTTGLFDSIGWKFPEDLAASRCIVSEPLKSQLPVPLQPGKHYLAFRTPLECVEACNRLLNDPVLARSMRHENYRYYRENVRPEQLILKCFNAAFDKV